MLKDEGITSSPSPLLSLPAELRNNILFQLFDVDTDKAKYTISGTKDTNLKASVRVKQKHWRGYEYESRCRGKAPVALLATCRQMYNEAAPIFYGNSVLHFDSPRVMANFFNHIGSAIELLTNVELGFASASQLRQSMEELARATQLEKLRLKAMYWAPQHWLQPRPRADRWLGGYAGFIHWANILANCEPLFVRFWKAGKSADEILDVVSFNHETFACVHLDGVPKADIPKTDVDSSEDHDDSGTEYDSPHTRTCCFKWRKYHAWLDGIKASMTLWLQTKTAEEKKRQERENAKAAKASKHLDDFSYLEAAPAPTRRDTGRPKRRTTLDKGVSYAEDYDA